MSREIEFQMTTYPVDAANDDGIRLGPGAMVLVVGPSGAGKDTLIRLARSHFNDGTSVLFPTRLITRGPDTHEDHEPVSAADLAGLVASDQVAMHWQAHGLDYAVPVSADKAVAASKVVVVNVSRRVIPVALTKYKRTVVVFVTAPADVLAGRLRQRGRETTDDVASRLARSASDALPLAPELVVIQNIGEPEIAAGKLIDLIESLVIQSRPAG